MLLLVTALAALVRPGDLAGLRHDLAAALTYLTNWWLIAQGDSYFGAGAHPPLLTHLWSLAVEEQFYLLWPLALVLLLRRPAGPRQRRWLLGVPVGVALVSTLLAALLYDPWHDPSRVYYGTDTRAVAPLLGAALAIVLRPGSRPAELTGRARAALDGGGVLALLALAGFTVLLTDRVPVLYRGGFLLVALVAGGLVVTAGHPASRLGQLLGAAPLAWVGDRSYAIYLWHWPLIAMIGAGGPVRDLLIVALAVTLAQLSYRYVEHPVRTGALLRAWRDRPRPLPTPLLAGLTVAVVGLACLGTRVLTATPVSAVPVGPGPATTLGALRVVSPSASGHASPSGTPTRSPSRPPGTLSPADLHGPAPVVGVFGDSQGMTLLLNAPADVSQYARLSDQTIEGCGILTGRVVSRTGERRDLGADCGDWLPQWRSRAARTRPGIALVMIGAWEVFDLTANGRAMAFGSPGWDATFSAALRQGVAALESSGARVALALLPCYRPIRASAGYWPERGDDARTRHVNDLLRAAADADPAKVSTVDPPGEFCTDPEIATDRDYRWDGVHYYKPGAALYLRTVLPQLLS
jgi:peptidoglycan/LPS O-acetylase OafA/YrhL